jgi:hypothetical protein
MIFSAHVLMTIDRYWYVGYSLRQRRLLIACLTLVDFLLIALSIVAAGWLWRLA